MPWGSVSDRVIGVAKDIYILAPISLFGGTEASDRDCFKHSLIVIVAATYNWGSDFSLPGRKGRQNSVTKSRPANNGRPYNPAFAPFMVTIGLFGSLPRRRMGGV